jgi:2-polyprenyl-6-methoxyphenol hydroxylase-like FAD-dependent oxidoreductase
MNNTNSDQTLDCDIAILGGGIAGPALAAALADSGFRIVLVERSDKPLDTTRGDQLQPSTSEHLHRWGVVDMMLARGAERRLGSRWLTPDGDLILHARADNLSIPHPYFLYLNHELISTVLLDRAAQNPNFSLLRPAKGRVLKDAVGPGEHSLIVTQDEKTTTINARCIAIADGRTSTSRKMLGIDAEVYQYKNPLLLMFAAREKSDSRNDLHVYLTPTGIVSAVPRTGDSWKIGFPVEAKDLGAWNKATASELKQRLGQLVPALSDLQPKISGVYPVSMVNAEHWSSGNCVLLGDACHALHPGRSQGMNIAFSNVATLAKHLLADDWRDSHEALLALLEEYETKKRPGIDARLADNHARGLEMDNLDPAQIETTKETMRGLASSPENLERYCMNAAGY